MRLSGSWWTSAPRTGPRSALIKSPSLPPTPPPSAPCCTATSRKSPSPVASWTPRTTRRAWPRRCSSGFSTGTWRTRQTPTRPPSARPWTTDSPSALVPAGLSTRPNMSQSPGSLRWWVLIPRRESLSSWLRRCLSQSASPTSPAAPTTSAGETSSGALPAPGKKSAGGPSGAT